MESTLGYIDIYCERTDGTFWSEPINAITNIAFILAAVYGFKLAKEYNKLTPLTLVLIILTAMIGIGSFLFHTVAQPWAAAADVIPIWLFVLIYIIAACERFLHLPPLRTVLSLVVIIVAVAALMTFISSLGLDRETLNGSDQYAPALFAVIVFTIIFWFKDHPVTSHMGATLFVLTLSLTFRTIDHELCHSFDIGTHFMWHTLNGLMFAILLRGMVRHGTDRKEQKND